MDFSSFTDSQWEKAIAQTISAVTSDQSPVKKYEYPALSSKEFAKCMDHTLLKIDATPVQIAVLCEEASKYGFKV